MPETMKSWHQEAFGLDNLLLSERPIPSVGEGEILVRVRAASLNYRDRLVVDGQLLPVLPEMPFTPVSDFAGEVVEIGETVKRVRVGDRVAGNFWTEWLDGPAPLEMINHAASLGGPYQGALAEYVKIPASVAVRIPAGLSFEEASTLPVAALTAWHALAETNPARPGDIVLVQGTGGVSLFGLQFAKELGARVIATSRSSEKLDRIAALGAWKTINSIEAAPWDERAQELTNGAGVNHILEVIGGSNLTSSAIAVAPEGTISLIGFLESGNFSLSSVPLMLKRARIQGVSVGHRASFERMVRFVEERSIHPVIDEIFSFDEVPKAFRRLEQGAFGKIVVSLEGQSRDRRSS
ncbi:zinc-dependent alcohol dehydrogenase family protein [Salipiger mucosus]|uniref:Alcohol dehydrogenase n=1 Tax=Salipiger mucosus DSM 16094 TaxID=1123237 RepID=S9Q8N6_9RHOB|nr:NAD(P)-dependent alcohol dehydrogenase [Salipiger mucosus]EPX76382.1 Alcohol dehydrogenase [Salipiger mucosus DSM 16094]